MSLIGRKWESTDPGAPVLNGTYGSMIAVLRAVLVEGYGSGSSAKAPAGWTEEFKGALPNVAVFRNNPITGTGAYFRVDDSDQPASTYSNHDGKLGWIRGYKSMTAVGAGTDQMPLASQLPWGAFIQKSTVANATAVPWVIYATELCFYLFTKPTSDLMVPHFIGDFVSDKPGDQFACSIGAFMDLSGAGGLPNPDIPQSKNFLSAWITTHDFVAMRSSNGASGAVNLRMNNLTIWSSTSEMFVGGNNSPLPFPDPITGGARFARPYFVDSVGIRGRLPGMWAPLHDRPFADGYVFQDDGMPKVEARSYRAPGGSGRGQILIEVDALWH